MDEPASLPPETPPADPPPLPPTKPAGEPFVFHGQAGEYFRIWIANVFLTMVTLGVYSAWAKVRKRRYLRGNVELLGHRFDYTARPTRLLIGNVVVVLFFLAYALFGSVYLGIKIGAIAVAIALLPWIVVRSLCFNAHNTVHRGTRFRFHPSLSAATLTYLLQFLTVIVTLGIYYPAWVHAKKRFQVDRHRFGTAYFHFDAKARLFYAAYVPPVLGALGVLLLAGASFALLKNVGHLQTLAVILTFAVYLPAVLLARTYIYVRVFNATWNGTRLDDSRFEADMRLGKWLRLQIGNWAAVLATLGLLYPWAVIRSARYTASCLRFHPSGDFERIQKFGGTAGAALGETAAELFGLDFGL